jgi:hypothetical protein
MRLATEEIVLVLVTMDVRMKLELFLVVFIAFPVKRRSRTMVLRYKNHTEKLQREPREFILLYLSQLN